MLEALFFEPEELSAREGSPSWWMVFPSSALTATGWSDNCRAGFARAAEWRLRAAYGSLRGCRPMAVRDRFAKLLRRLQGNFGSELLHLEAPLEVVLGDALRAGRIG